jgi:hypothetical protein
MNYACTLFEGHYHFGVAVLINSLYQNNFKGVFIAGYRGSLPPWAINCVKEKTYKDGTDYLSMPLNNDCEVIFIKITTSWHLTNYKSKFIQNIFDLIPSLDSQIYYFDPDIVVKCDIIVLEKWHSHGICLVEDCTFPYMPDNHFIRSEWKKILQIRNIPITREFSRYYNAGFIALSRKNIDFLSMWTFLLMESENHGYNLSQFTTSSRGDTWAAADQDHLNLTLMVTEDPISTVGPDGMDFEPAGFLLSHAVGPRKPWRRSYVIEAIQGFPPSRTDKIFWEYANGPIYPFSNLKIKLSKLSLKIGILIGRFIQRSR